MKPVGLLGGSFDPVHHGHLRLAIEVMEALDLEHVRLVPLNVPNASKSPVATGEQRLAMLRAAVAGESRLVPDDRELRRGGISYTVETLQSLREELPNQPLCLILGMDAYQRIGTWHQWQRLLTLSHIVIAARPGAGAFNPADFPEPLVRAETHDPDMLRKSTGGNVYRQCIQQLEISSTQIRERIRHGLSVRYLVPDSVLDIIHRHQLYSRQE